MNHGKNVIHNAQDLSGKGLKRKMKVAKNEEPSVNQTIPNQRVVTQWVHRGAMGIA